MSADDPARQLLSQMLIEAAQKRGASSSGSNDTNPAMMPASQPIPETRAELVPTIDLFDPAEIRRKIGDVGAMPDTCKIGGDGRSIEFDMDDRPAEPDPRSSEEIAWERRLKALLENPGNPARRLLIADQTMIARIEELHSQSPHFCEVIGLVSRAAKLSFVTQSPLALPPILLLGAPGIGKSFFAQSLAEAIGTHLERIAMDMLSDHGALTGLSLSWKAARPGRIALGLLESRTASPVFFLDEVDKVNPIHFRENPLAFLHSVLEPENARRFMDEYLTIAMRADHAIWILTANSTDRLPDSILDRLTIFSIPEPDKDALRTIIRHIYAATNARFNHAFEPELQQPIVDQLLAHNPRTISKLFRLAFGFAVVENRSHLTTEDIERARLIIEMQGGKTSMGFL